MAAGQGIAIGRSADVPVGSGRVVETVGKTLAIFTVEGRFYAIDNECSHRGGPLGDGDLDGKIVLCPWHAWRWDVTTGANVNNPAVKLSCYAITERDGMLYVDLGG
jgi:nitrite reductase/ring-hydroxylating ferredoxin subunit